MARNPIALYDSPAYLMSWMTYTVFSCDNDEINRILFR